MYQHLLILSYYKKKLRLIPHPSNPLSLYPIFRWSKKKIYVTSFGSFGGGDIYFFRSPGVKVPLLLALIKGYPR